MRKQSESQIIGREGERWFESVLPPEWSIQRPIDDFGLDGIVAVGSKTALTPLEFGVQIKSSKKFRTHRDHIIVPKIHRDMILYWGAKFFPTLIVAYNTSNKTGYFDWISNLVSKDEIDKNKAMHYLHVPLERIITPDCWPNIHAELSLFHEEFSAALRSRREIIPIAASLAALLRNLCASKMADISNHEQMRLYAMAQAWTHEEVIRQLDLLIPGVDAGSVARHRLSRFRQAYFELCEKIFHDFKKQISEKNVHWILMKKPPDSDVTINELIAMLSDAVSGLLHHAQQRD